MNGIYGFCICIILFSCSKNRIPKDILPPEKMEKLMWEQMRSDAFIKDFVSLDTTKNLKAENKVLQEKIFRKYNTTSEIFYRSYDFYLHHDNMMRDLLDSVIAKEIRTNEKEKEKLKLKLKNGQKIPER